MADKYLSAAGKRRRLYINTIKVFDELMDVLGLLYNRKASSNLDDEITSNDVIANEIKEALEEEGYQVDVKLGNTNLSYASLNACIGFADANALLYSSVDNKPFMLARNAFVPTCLLV